MKRSFNMMGSGSTGVNVNYGTVVQIIGPGKKTKQPTNNDTTIVVNNARGGVTTVVRSPADTGTLIYLSTDADWLRYAKWKRLRKFWFMVEALAPHVTRDVVLAVHALLFDPLQQDIVLHYIDNDRINGGFINKRETIPIHIAITPLCVIEASIPALTAHHFVAGGVCYRKNTNKKVQPFRFTLDRNYDDANLRISYRRESPCVMESSTVIRTICMEWSLLDYLIMMAEREKIDDIFSGPC